MKKTLTAVFLVFISVLFIGTTGKFAREVAWYMREEGIKRGVLHVWDILNTLENSYQEKLVGHDAMININGAFNRATFSDAVPSVNKDNSVYRLKNDYISFIVDKFEKFSEDQLNSIDKTVEAANETGAKLLFVSVPPKVCSEDDFVLEGVKNREYEIIDYRINQFKNKGFETLNLHENLHKQNKDHYNYFYRTDHHWNADAGLWASEEISKWLSEKGFNVDLSTFSKENYNEIMIEDLFLGSQGKQVGIFYAGVDDFKYFVPKFETNYSISTGKERLLTGTFEETLFAKENLVKNYMESFNYSSFLGGDFALTKIENNLNEEGPKILMIKDSFTNVLSVYFAAECSELHLIDPRHYKESVSEYIKENDFDVVIVSLSSRMSNNNFNWED